MTSPSAVCAFLGLAAFASTSFSQIHETFEQPFASSLFGSHQILSGSGTFITTPLGFGIGAPNTAPALPINVGGDNEVRYFEAGPGIAPTHSFALTQPLPWPTEVQYISGIVSLGWLQPGGGTGGFVLRGSSGGTFNTVSGYSMSANIASPTSVQFALQRITNGILSSSLATFDAVADFDNENYGMVFAAAGDQLAAQVYRVTAPAGILSAQLLTTLTATDATYQTGTRAGIVAFARGNHSVFFDDITLGQPLAQPVPEPSTYGLLAGLLLCGATVARRLRRK